MLGCCLNRGWRQVVRCQGTLHVLMRCRRVGKAGPIHVTADLPAACLVPTQTAPPPCGRCRRPRARELGAPCMWMVTGAAKKAPPPDGHHHLGLWGLAAVHAAVADAARLPPAACRLPSAGPNSKRPAPPNVRTELEPSTGPTQFVEACRGPWAACLGPLAAQIGAKRREGRGTETTAPSSQ